jgi:hypothetical protein
VLEKGEKIKSIFLICPLINIIINFILKNLNIFLLKGQIKKMLFIFSPFSSTLRLKSLFALNKNIYALLRNVFINITHELLTTLNNLINN